MEIRASFHKRLQAIQDEVLAMGSMVEKAIERSVEALKNRDIKLLPAISILKRARLSALVQRWKNLMHGLFLA